MRPNLRAVAIDTVCCASSISWEFTCEPISPTLKNGMGVGLELSDSRGLVKSQDTFDVGRCQTVRRREVGMPRIGV